MLGIYFLDYCDKPYPRRARKMFICYKKEDTLVKIKDIPEDYYCWLSECQTPGYLVFGQKSKVIEWIELHMPEKFKEPLRNME